MEDNSELRRGLPVAHTVYGVPQTINTANYVYFLAVQELLKLERSIPDERAGGSKGKGKAEAGDLVAAVNGESTVCDCCRVLSKRSLSEAAGRFPRALGEVFIFLASECCGGMRTRKVDVVLIKYTGMTLIDPDELLQLHRGQGLDLFWRDSLQCPTEEEYIQMVLGSESAACCIRKDSTRRAADGPDQKLVDCSG